MTCSLRKATPHRESGAASGARRPRSPHPHPGVASDGTAGLLASGSSYFRAFPREQPLGREIRSRSGTLRFRTRTQWRGPRRTLTGFPFEDGDGLLSWRPAVTAPSSFIKEALHGGGPSCRILCRFHYCGGRLGVRVVLTGLIRLAGMPCVCSVCTPC